jgi:hypothetical protein
MVFHKKIIFISVEMEISLIISLSKIHNSFSFIKKGLHFIIYLTVIYYKGLFRVIHKKHFKYIFAILDSSNIKTPKL